MLIPDPPFKTDNVLISMGRDPTTAPLWMRRQIGRMLRKKGYVPVVRRVRGITTKLWDIAGRVPGRKSPYNEEDLVRDFNKLFEKGSGETEAEVTPPPQPLDD